MFYNVLIFLQGPDAVNGLTTDDVSLDESSEDVDPDSWEQVGPKKKSVLTRRVCTSINNMTYTTHSFYCEIFTSINSMAYTTHLFYCEIFPF